jgi:hypothetical protein
MRTGPTPIIRREQYKIQNQKRTLQNVQKKGTVQNPNLGANSIKSTIRREHYTIHKKVRTLKGKEAKIRRE